MMDSPSNLPSVSVPSVIKTRPSRTKIVATIGPASEDEKTLAALIHAGVDVFRLNMAHGKIDISQERLDRIRKISRELNTPVGVLADLAGPKMRLGTIPNDVYNCIPEKEIRFVRGETTTEPDSFTTTYEPLIDDIDLGDRIMLADGTVICVVVAKESDALTCRIEQGGTIRSRQGVNLPGVRLSIRTLQEIDIVNARWAVRAGIDFLGLSFVRSPNDIRELRAILREAAEPEQRPKPVENSVAPAGAARNPEGSGGGASGESNPCRNDSLPHIIAKIEKPEALEHLEAIIEAADGIMVARGDLGVETDIARIALVQKRIIETCRKKVKPVIVATQMLESMHHATIPTRAEATDVANAILDGTDACMLSGETAVGEHPVRAVEMMHRIALETENLVRDREAEKAWVRYTESALQEEHARQTAIPDLTTDAASYLARSSEAQMILISTVGGRTALRLSKYRNFAMTVGCSTSPETLQRMCLYWGVIPIDLVAATPRRMLDEVVEQGLKSGHLEKGDRIVLVADPSNGTENRRMLYIHEV